MFSSYRDLTRVLIGAAGRRTNSRTSLLLRTNSRLDEMSASQTTEPARRPKESMKLSRVATHTQAAIRMREDARASAFSQKYAKQGEEAEEGRDQKDKLKRAAFAKEPPKNAVKEPRAIWKVGEWVGGSGAGGSQFVGHLGFVNSQLTAARFASGRLLKVDLIQVFEKFCLMDGSKKRLVDGQAVMEMNAVRSAFEQLKIKISVSFLKHLIRGVEAFNRREASPRPFGGAGGGDGRGGGGGSSDTNGKGGGGKGGGRAEGPEAK